MKLLSGKICLLKLCLGRIQSSASTVFLASGNWIVSSLAVWSELTLVVVVARELSVPRWVLAGCCGTPIGCIKGAWTFRWTPSGIRGFVEQEIQVRCVYSSHESFGPTTGCIHLYERMVCVPDVMRFRSHPQWDGSDGVCILISSLAWTYHRLFNFEFSFFPSLYRTVLGPPSKYTFALWRSNLEVVMVELLIWLHL